MYQNHLKLNNSIVKFRAFSYSSLNLHESASGADLSMILALLPTPLDI